MGSNTTPHTWPGVTAPGDCCVNVRGGSPSMDSDTASDVPASHESSMYTSTSRNSMSWGGRPVNVRDVVRVRVRMPNPPSTKLGPPHRETPTSALLHSPAPDSKSSDANGNSSGGQGVTVGVMDGVVVCVGVTDGDTEMVAVLDGVAVSDGVCDGELEDVGVAEGVLDAEALLDGVRVAVVEGVGVRLDVHDGVLVGVVVWDPVNDADADVVAAWGQVDVTNPTNTRSREG